MQIALIGYGKMGKLIKEIAQRKGHNVVVCLTRTEEITPKNLANVDICIDFSHPDSVVDNIKKVISLKKSLVVGTTGWYGHLSEIEPLVQAAQVGLLYSPNFSLGVQLFLKIIADAAARLSHYSDYDASIFEAHHKAKVDTPSGTAHAIKDALNRDSVTISSIRCGSIPGTHTVYFDSPADTITLTHQARNREGFAIGAVVAAEWLQGKKGLFTLDAMLN